MIFFSSRSPVAKMNISQKDTLCLVELNTQILEILFWARYICVQVYFFIIPVQNFTPVLKKKSLLLIEAYYLLCYAWTNAFFFKKKLTIYQLFLNKIKVKKVLWANFQFYSFVCFFISYYKDGFTKVLCGKAWFVFILILNS